MSIISIIKYHLFPNWKSIERECLCSSIRYEGVSYKLYTYFDILYSDVRNDYKLSKSGHNPKLYPSVELAMLRKINDLREKSRYIPRKDPLIEIY